MISLLPRFFVTSTNFFKDSCFISLFAALTMLQIRHDYAEGNAALWFSFLKTSKRRQNNDNASDSIKVKDEETEREREDLKFA